MAPDSTAQRELRVDLTGALMDVESIGSWPEITPRVVAASWTVLESGPMQSREDANARRPLRDTRPYVGFTPTHPLKLAGSLTDPPVSLPSAIGTWPPATAAALPPDDPPTHK